MSSRWGALAETLDDAQRAAVHRAAQGREDSVDPGAIARLRQSFERVEYARSAPSVLRASGVKIGKMSAQQLRIAAGNRQPWQALAWRYRDMIAELRYALQFRARAISRVRFYVAEIIDDDDEPIPVSLRNDDDPEKAKRVTLPEDFCAAAEAELARLPLGAGYEFLGVWSENYDVAGDCWLHGFTNPLTGQEEWKIRSVEAVDIQGNSITIKNELGQPRKLNLDKEEIHRLWVPHPAYPHLGDSALNALGDVLEDICLVGRELRAVSRSRIMQNGALFVPDSMATSRNMREEDDTPEGRRKQWMADFEAALLAPIANEGDAGGVVPMVITGTADDIKAVRFERFEREESPLLLEKLAKSLGRMANGLDIPPEILTGMADANHWTAWQIDHSTFRHHLEPSIRLMVDSLTGSFLRTALATQYPPELLARVRIWYDAGQITENPNRRQDALDALDRILIGPAAGREALGFNDGDAPTAEEALQLIAAKNGVDQATAAAILAWHAEQEGVADLPVFPSSTSRPHGRQGEIGTRAGEGNGDSSAPGGTGAPATAPDGIAASAHPWPNTCACGSYADATGQCVSSPRVHAALLGLPQDEPLQLAAADVRPLVGTPDQVDRFVTGQRHGVTYLPNYTLDATAARDLGDIDTALRDQILAAADQAAKEALRRAGSRLRSKATSPKLANEVRAQLQTLPVDRWAAALGPDQCLALNAGQRFLLAGAWEGLSGKFATLVRDAARKVARRVQRMLGLSDDSLEAQVITRQMAAEMEARIDPAWARLQDSLDAHLEQVMFRTGDGVDVPGEVPDFDIPPRLVRDALAEIGGDQTAEGLPVTGLGNGSTVRGTLSDRGAVHVGMEWRYGYMPRNTFHPHENLDGQRFTSWSDDVLAVQPGDEWIGSPWYHPGDHAGCLCSWFTVYALPDGGASAMSLTATPPTSDTVTALREDFLHGKPGTPNYPHKMRPATRKRLEQEQADKKAKGSTTGAGPAKKTRAKPAKRETKDAPASGRDALKAAPLGMASPELRVNGDPGIDSEVDILRMYKGPGYEHTNRYLRTGSGSDFNRETVAKMDSALDKSKLTSDIVTHRGIKDPRAMFGDRVDGDLTGLEWRDDAFLSTTADERIAQRFAEHRPSADGGMVLDIRVPAGAPMVRLSQFAPDDEVLTDASQEAELLGGRGWTLRIVGDSGPDGRRPRRVTAEVTNHAR